MSNPIYRQGPIGKDAASAVLKNRLVRLTADGKVEHAAATGAVFGAITEKADPAKLLSAVDVAVHYGPAVVDLSVVEGGVISAGAAVFAAADGQVAATGTVQVGVANMPSTGGYVEAVLNNLPVAG